MSKFGKFIGGFFGFLLAGPLGLLLGIFIGHLFDRGIHRQWNAMLHFQTPFKAQQAFFDATFLVMGCIAKADGRVSEQEIQAVRGVMDRMGLNTLQRQKAMDLFAEGKQPDFQLAPVLERVLEASQHNAILLRLFVELQLQVALAEGVLHPEKQQILQVICHQLGVSLPHFAFFSQAFGAGGFESWSGRQYAGAGSSQYSYRHAHAGRTASSLEDAYQLLGIRADAADPEVKRAYRRLMSQHHPDKLVSKGLPEEMIKLATEKTQQIRAAYELICKARGMS